jgi:hypothetical protein
MIQAIFSRLSAILTGAVMLCTASAAHAVVIDFESLQHIDTNVQFHGFTYSEDGFTITNITGLNPLATFGTLDSRFTGSTALFNNDGDGTTQLARTDGGVFNLQSIDLAELSGSSVATVSFTGNLTGGGTVMQAFNLDGVAFGAETFAFSGFSNLVSVTWTQASPFHQFDNIDVSNVPLPAALPLFLTTLSVMGLLGWHRRKLQAV